MKVGDRVRLKDQPEWVGTITKNLGWRSVRKGALEFKGHYLDVMWENRGRRRSMPYLVNELEVAPEKP